MPKKEKTLTKKGLLLKILQLQGEIKYLKERITSHKIIFKKVIVKVPVFKLIKKEKKCQKIKRS